jgi:Na+/proline symporter
MPELDPALTTWSWIFLAMYVAIMVVCGVIGMRRVRSGDDFATARGGYGAVFLSFALVATTASGGTFLGVPAIAYSAGLSGLWYAFIYPAGVYTGIMISMRVVTRAGHVFGNRSVPEYLGDRYQSEFLRLAVAVFSLLLLFYLAAQLLAGTVMFEQMMGIPKFWALVITSGILLGYIAIGGAHADILTDGIQGALMLILAIGVIAMFWIGFGIEGGFQGMLTRLEELDPQNVAVLREGHPLVGSWWGVFAIWAAHLPLGMLPHIGNKLWALKDETSTRTTPSRRSSSR